MYLTLRLRDVGAFAFLTAQVFLRLLRAAKAAGGDNLASLCAPH
jgi:hypothetical protein